MLSALVSCVQRKTIKCGTGANILGYDVAICSVCCFHTRASLSVHINCQYHIMSVIDDKYGILVE